MLAVAGLLAGGVGGVHYGIQQRDAAEQQRQQTEQQQRFEAAEARPHLPNAVLTALVVAIAKDDPLRGCMLFSTTAGQQLARAVGAASCPAAIGRLAGQVVGRDRYTSPTSRAARCRPAVGRGARGRGRVRTGLVGDVRRPAAPPPGPRVGRLDLALQQHIGYLIVGYTPCQR